MPPGTAIDADQFLDCLAPSPSPAMKGLAAWEQAYAALEQTLSWLGPQAELFVVFGVQAGKSTWVRDKLPTASSSAVSPWSKEDDIPLATREGA